MHHITVDLSRMANDIVRGLRECAPDRNASVVVADNMVVEGDSGLLRIAMENLLEQIVHRHSGEIWAEAAVDRGACFYFTLPTVERLH